jgi:Tfp pilus assembly protein PilN
MTDLNFLPITEQGQLKQEFRLLRLRRASFSLLAISLIIAGVLWGNFMLLRRHELSLKQSIESAGKSQLTSQTAGLEKQIKEFNIQVKTLRDIEQNRIPIASRVSKILASIPGGVSIEQFSMDLVGKKATIRGVAKDRESYLGLQAALTSTDYFTNIDLPITDFLSRELIRFTIDAPFSPELLKPDASNET